MFLKQLEVKGFKSFAAAMTIEFTPGLTAVVGPNGSGKSNIADAIRWVLGEQSVRSLRGARMQDVIFAGSDTRKAVNVAEVTLVLNNDEGRLPLPYHEVSVTRRLYRSGESEYLLNRQPCRLKDITDLFLDSGLGREAYSIIGQGKVEELLSSKPEDRRVIFEEAAGVLTYKTRKKEALKRLTQTEENLLRVTDVLIELNEQVQPLEEQAAIAKEYIHLSDTYRALDIQILAHEMGELHTDWTQASAQLSAIKGQLDVRQVTLAESEQTLRKYRDEHEALQTQWRETQNELLTVSEALEKNEGLRNVLVERKKHAEQSGEQLRATMATQKQHIQQLKEKLAKLLADRKQLQDQLQEMASTLHEVKQALSLTEKDIERQIEDAKSDYIERLNEQASLRHEKRYLTEQQNQRTRSSRRTTEAQEKLQAEHEKLQARLRVLEDEHTALATAYEAAKRATAHALEMEETARTRFYKQEATLYEAYGTEQKIKARQEALQELEDAHAGFFHGVKEVLKQREKGLSGVVGAVAECLRVSKRFETAIDVALGAQMQHIIVQDEHSARTAINFLKKNRLGRATFLPLATVQGKTMPEHVHHALAQTEGFLGLASALITYDVTYEKAMQHLLGTTVIAEDLPAANRLAKVARYRFRIVTLAGEVVSPGGAMTGGSLKQNQSSILQRKREQEELKQQYEQVQQEITRLEQQVKQRAAAKAQHQQTLQELKRTEEAKQQAWRAKEDELARVREEVRALTQEKARVDRQNEERDTEARADQQRLQQLANSEQELVVKIQAVTDKIAALEKQRATQQQSKETLQAKQTELRIKQAECKQQLHHVDTHIEEVRESLAQVEQALAVNEEADASHGRNHDAQTESETTLAQKIAAGAQQKQTLTAQVTALEAKRIDLNERYAALEQAVQEEQAVYARLQAESQKLDVHVNRLDVDLDYRLNRLSQTYELSYEAAVEAYPLSGNIDKVRTERALVERSLDEIGPVNTGAIEEYERVQARVSFLTAQQEDLQAARVSLDKAIAEMDEEMTRRFSETFARIRGHFQDVFKQLFGGGDADLLLTAPQQLLETGVEIMVRPPGKKRQLLALLSGGERALTAIALLFAMLRVRAVPFCVLDEVEAALDEANVSRFAQYLHTLAQENQFIVITHRKGTMEEADVLYGVTMEESGVSRLVSVKLEETAQFIES
ncbi:chromosome segregation protein SMC [Bacillus sp. FSL W7-1360]